MLERGRSLAALEDKRLEGHPRWRRYAPVAIAALLAAWLATERGGAFVGSSRAATPLTSSPDAAAPAGSPARPPLLLVAGSSLTGYAPSPDLWAELAADAVPLADTLPFLFPPGAEASSETLSLGDPVFSHPLPGPLAELRPPARAGEPVYAATRAGLVRFDPTQPKRPPELLLPGWDLASLAVLGDGTVLLLERNYGEDLRTAVPAPLLAWRPETTQAPETLAVCTAGATRLLVAPGDSVVWVTRLFGRTIDRIARREGAWEKREVAVVPRVWNEDRFDLRIGFTPYGNDVLLLDQGRGMRPRLLAIDASGGTRPLYTWARGLRTTNAAFAPQESLLVLNGITNLSLLRLGPSGEWSYSTGSTVTSTGLTADGRWIALAALDPAGERTAIHLRCRGSARLASARLRDVISAMYFLPS